MPADHLLDGLTPEQVEAVTSPARPLVVLAGAGAGKTRVLTRRIAWRVAEGSADPRRVLALTFTRKAAGELRGRLDDLGVAGPVTAGTFHAIAYAQLRRLYADRRKPLPVLMARKARLVASVLSGLDRAQVPVIVGEIEWAKARLVTPDSYVGAAAHRRCAIEPDVVAAAYRRYELEKTRRGVLDLDDLIVHCAAELEQDAQFSAAQRWWFRHLFVDEFQDVNPAQHRLLQAWLGPSADLCVVGDPDQAIYGWNGADPTLLSDVAAAPQAVTVRLSANHRCSPQIVAAAAAVLDDGVARSSTRALGPTPTVSMFEHDAAEAEAIAHLVSRCGRRWGDIAVLVRTNGQVPRIHRALERAGVPCRVRTAALTSLPGVGEALAVLDESFSVQAWRRDVAAELSGLGDAVRTSVEALVAIADEHLGSDAPLLSPKAFRAWIESTVEPADVLGADAVEVATFHRAKGLEWPMVVVAGVEEGYVPIAYAADRPAAFAEERNLLYVALTRAADELHLTWAAERTFGDVAVGRAPSPWLAAIEGASAPRVADWRSGLALARRALMGAPTATVG